jgi:23S rRNA pseudoU1915 N3-methylase RlmH
MVVEIPENPNCEAMELRVFQERDAERPARQVRLERRPGQPAQWCDAIGWNLDGTTTTATARKVDDSGDGTVLLITGGTGGLRLQTAAAQTPWRLSDPTQWGEPLLLLGDPADVR